MVALTPRSSDMAGACTEPLPPEGLSSVGVSRFAIADFVAVFTLLLCSSIPSSTSYLVIASSVVSLTKLITVGLPPFIKGHHGFTLPAANETSLVTIDTLE